MSKVDGPRAIREARHAAYRAAQSKAGAVGAASAEVAGPPVPADGAATQQPAVRKKAPQKATAIATAPAPGDSAAPVEAVDSSAEALCGHRSMNGRSCRRPAGHSEKSHRYA